MSNNYRIGHFIRCVAKFGDGPTCKSANGCTWISMVLRLKRRSWSPELHEVSTIILPLDCSWIHERWQGSAEALFRALKKTVAGTRARGFTKTVQGRSGTSFSIEITLGLAQSKQVINFQGGVSFNIATSGVDKEVNLSRFLCDCMVERVSAILHTFDKYSL